MSATRERSPPSLATILSSGSRVVTRQWRPCSPPRRAALPVSPGSLAPSGALRCPQKTTKWGQYGESLKNAPSSAPTHNLNQKSHLCTAIWYFDSLGGNDRG